MYGNTVPPLLNNRRMWYTISRDEKTDVLVSYLSLEHAGHIHKGLVGMYTAAYN